MTGNIVQISLDDSQGICMHTLSFDPRNNSVGLRTGIIILFVLETTVSKIERLANVYNILGHFSQEIASFSVLL